jgi:ubiquinone biosynthesis accessory factor UbiJ
MPATPVWLAAIESVLNRSIDQSSRAAAAAGRLNHTALRIDIDGLWRIRASVSVNRLALTAGDELDADTVISGSPFALFELLSGGTAGGAKGNQRTAARMTGDAEIAARYRELFALARPDLEEELSRLIGDLPARRVSLLAQAARSWARRFGRTARENLAEYLEEESRDLVNKPELEEFLAGVDHVREMADRVEARLARVEQRLKGAT